MPLNIFGLFTTSGMDTSMLYSSQTVRFPDRGSVLKSNQLTVLHSILRVVGVYWDILYLCIYLVHRYGASGSMRAAPPRARVPFPVGTSFLGEVFSGFFLTCKTNVRKL